MKIDFKLMAGVLLSIVIILGVPYLFISFTLDAFGNVQTKVEERTNKKINENPSEYSKETIIDIQFERDESFFSISENLFVKTQSQTYIFSNFSVTYAATKSDTSYLQTETRLPNTKEEDIFLTIFLSQEDLGKYSEAYAQEFESTLKLKQLEEVEKSI